MDRDRVTKPNAQIGFIRFVLLPLFESLSKVTQLPNSVYLAILFYRATITIYLKLIIKNLILSPHLTQFTIQIDDLTPEENQSGMKNYNCPK